MDLNIEDTVIQNILFSYLFMLETKVVKSMLSKDVLLTESG